MSRPVTAYLARWVCPVTTPVIEDGAVLVRDGLIESVGAVDQLDLTGTEIVELGTGALIPGLINAHTHLEFSGRKDPIGEAGIEFTQWIRQLMSARGQTDVIEKRRAIRQGMREAFATGTWWVGEIATDPVSLDDYQPPAGKGWPYTTVFLELLGRSEQKRSANRTTLNSFFAASLPTMSQTAISPHAPYSVAPALLDELCRMAEIQHCSLAMHLAETKQELELLDQLTGPFVDMLREFNVWDPATFQPRQSITEILERLASCPRSLVIHGNYLNENQLDLIASHRDRMSVVFCPRTHTFFQHDDYPLKAMLTRNINVAIGTDSRASNPDLSLYAELQEVANRFPELDWQDILKLGTINGARALTIQPDLMLPTGTLQVGVRAALSLIRPRATDQNREIADWIFADQATCEPVE